MREDDRLAAVRLFDHFGLKGLTVDVASLERIYDRVRDLPYENFTKLIKKHSGTPASSWPRLPDEVVRDYLAWRSGGTCFSLTKLLETLLLEVGFPCYPVLADMAHGREIHCALIAVADSKRFLLDPSYLLPRPMGLRPDGSTAAKSPANTLVLDGENATTYRLFTQKAGQPLKWRYGFSDQPAAEDRFMARWLDSFDQTMMNSLVMTTLSGERQLYLHNDRLQEVTTESRRTTALRSDFADALGELFGVDGSLARRAHETWLDVRKAGRLYQGSGGQGGRGAGEPGSTEAREQGRL